MSQIPPSPPAHDYPSRGADAVPSDEAEVTAAAAALGFRVPDAGMAGVVANLALLAGHAAILARDA